MKELPEDWSQYTVGDLIKFEGGSQPPRSTFISEPRKGYIRLIQIRDYRTDKYPTYVPIEMARKFCTNDDIMIGRYGPPIFQILKGLEGAYNVALIKAIPSSKIIKKYTWHFLKSPSLFQYIDALSQRSSGQTGIEMDALKDYLLPLPPICEQENICFILDKWDSAIEKLDSLIFEKEKLRKGLMQQLLSGKKRFSEFNKDWKTVRLGDISTRVIRKNNVENTNILTISAQMGLVSQQDYYKKRVASADLSTYYLINKGNFAYNKSYSAGYPYGAIKRLELYDAGVVSCLYLCFEINLSENDEDFFAHFFEAGMLNHGIYRIAQEGARNHGLLNIGTHDFFNIMLNIPCIGEQRKIASTLNNIDKEVNLLKQKLDAFKAQKKGLLQQLLTGNVRVKITEVA